jgi:serine/threonine protein kinase
MSDPASPLPLISSRYQILDTIATGGMAVIYKAQDIVLERQVALKVLKKELSIDEQFRIKFRSEAKASAKLIHPNIITVFDFGFDGEHLYLVMEYIDGVDLKTIINEDGPINLNQALDYLIQAGKGLGFAHNSGFVHCDVKPQNMLVTKSGVLKITDFGVARALESISRDEKYEVVWGSPYYLSPEQASGKPPSPASDVYSLGIIAYELVTGKLPFLADNSTELVKMHRNTLPLPPIDINPDLPESLSQAILKALSKDPGERFQNGDEFYKYFLNIQKSFPFNPIKVKSENKSDLKSDPEGFNGIPRSGIMKFSTITLAILALILVGGLIPFCLYVILSINSLNR